MTIADPKDTLLDYLQNAREALVWKLEGLPEYDVRRPLTPTGTNLLGLVKHLASVELGYFGDTFGRPHGEELPWHADGADMNDDLYVTPGETREDVVGLYHRAWAMAADTVAACDLDTVGEVPWWAPERRQVTLHQILVHMVAETCRHAGHADILREGLDGAAGRFAQDANMTGDYDWPAHVARVEAAAAATRGADG
ncbi:DinB family protein [Nocardioides sp. KIGAM211]|uniref:DinB family protein n=1 Tax=Nocardioides luti TaxID=2761101 RepID=A0A7X0RD30_9ACTN|nr:DinB family protein [Nocardioides luti]MBB6626026.1 DinB family protein [Nocardioides luti]